MEWPVASDVVTQDNAGRRRGVRKGARISAKKKDAERLVKKQIINRPVIEESVKMTNVSGFEWYFALNHLVCVTGSGRVRTSRREEDTDKKERGN